MGDTAIHAVSVQSFRNIRREHGNIGSMMNVGGHASNLQDQHSKEINSSNDALRQFLSEILAAQKNFDINSKTAKGDTPLIVAIQHAHVAAMTELISPPKIDINT